jgi:hypothetical protein
MTQYLIFPIPFPARAARHYDERGLAALVLWISVVNVFRRDNGATRQVPGQRLPRVTGNSGIEK